jgi:hypothetical protein
MIFAAAELQKPVEMRTSSPRSRCSNRDAKSARRSPGHRKLYSAKAEETQNREHDNDSADKPDQIVHWEPFSCLN